jgi:ubiquinone/menaquinone biosynthesis C-methylase UbiE
VFDSVRELRDRLSPVAGLRVLDLGGGSGRKSARFAQGAREIVVLDPRPRGRARDRRGRESLRYVKGVAERLPFASGRFDRVVSVLSLHHFRDGPTTLRESHRVLAPGGSLTICDAAEDSVLARVFRSLHRLARAESLTFSAETELEARLRESGFVRVHRGRRGPLVFLTAEK